MLFTQRQFREALNQYTDALEAVLFENVFAFELLYGRAKAQSKIGHFSDAINDCDRGLKIKPTHLNIVLLRAECHQYLDAYANAINDYKTALNNNEVKMNSQQYNDIKSKITHLKQSQNHENAEMKKCTGDEQFSENNFEHALKLYAEAVELWPENVSFQNMHAVCLMKMDDYIGAFKAYQSALTIDKNSIESYHGMMKCCLILGDISGAERAIRNFEECKTKNDNIVDRYKNQCSNLRTLEEKTAECYNKNNFQSARKLKLF